MRQLHNAKKHLAVLVLCLHTPTLNANTSLVPSPSCEARLTSGTVQMNVQALTLIEQSRSLNLQVAARSTESWNAQVAQRRHELLKLYNSLKSNPELDPAEIPLPLFTQSVAMYSAISKALSELNTLHHLQKLSDIIAIEKSAKEDIARLEGSKKQSWFGREKPLVIYKRLELRRDQLEQMLSQNTIAIISGDLFEIKKYIMQLALLVQLEADALQSFMAQISNDDDSYYAPTMAIGARNFANLNAIGTTLESTKHAVSDGATKAIDLNQNTIELLAQIRSTLLANAHIRPKELTTNAPILSLPTAYMDSHFRAFEVGDEVYYAAIPEYIIVSGTSLYAIPDYYRTSVVGTNPLRINRNTGNFINKLRAPLEVEPKLLFYAKPTNKASELQPGQKIKYHKFELEVLGIREAFYLVNLNGYTRALTFSEIINQIQKHFLNGIKVSILNDYDFEQIEFDDTTPLAEAFRHTKIYHQSEYHLLNCDISETVVLSNGTSYKFSNKFVVFPISVLKALLPHLELSRSVSTTTYEVIGFSGTLLKIKITDKSTGKWKLRSIQLSEWMDQFQNSNIEPNLKAVTDTLTFQSQQYDSYNHSYSY